LPERQHRVEVDGRQYRLDFAWPPALVALEADGYATHGGRLSFERDHRRLAALTSAGWRVLAVTWEQISREPDRVIRQLGAMLQLSLNRDSRSAKATLQ
jgi:very-short-patch-repair endonuclease